MPCLKTGIFAKGGVMGKRVLTICLLLAAFVQSAVNAGELSQERCSELLSTLKPGKDAVWRSIPWRLSVLEARAIALKEDKPVFIWAMDGHPLGCV